jgi:hypothetical protein
MPLPNFTADEKYLINYMKSRAVRYASGYMFGYVAGGLLLCGFAVYYDSIALMVSAFLVVCGFRLYEEWYQHKYMPVWRSVLQKYESAVVEGQDNGGPAQVQWSP